MRSLGIDLGSKRIGVAMSDSSGVIASPLTVVARSASHSQDHKKIQELIDEYEVECVVVGMPLSMSGKVGPAAKSAQDEIEEMKSSLSVPVYSYDQVPVVNPFYLSAKPGLESILLSRDFWTLRGR